MELADIVEAKREAERALIENQQQEVRISIPHRPGSRLVRRQSPQQVSESSPPAFTLMNPTKREVTHALGVLEQIKRDMSHLFPQVESLLKERVHSHSSLRRVSSRKSQVEKLPSVPLTNPVNLVAAPVASDKEEVKPTRSLSQKPSKISQSTLAAISQMWANAVEEAAIENATPQTLEESQPEQYTMAASQTMEDSQLERSTKDTTSQTLKKPQLQQSSVETISQNKEEPQLQQSTAETAPQTIMKEFQELASQTMDEELQQPNVEIANMEVQARSCSSLWSEALTIGDDTVVYKDGLDELRSSASTPVTQTEPLELYTRPPSVKYHLIALELTRTEFP